MLSCFLQISNKIWNDFCYNKAWAFIRLMVRQKTKEPKVDSEFIYAYAKIDRLGEIEEFILMPNAANLPNVGDRL